MKKYNPINLSSAAFGRLAGRTALLGGRRRLINRLMDRELLGTSPRAEILCLWLMLERTAPDISSFREAWSLSGFRGLGA